MNRKTLSILLAAVGLPATSLCGASMDLVIADFEGTNYGTWKSIGAAFGEGPVRGTLPNQQKVTGFVGEGLVNTYRKGDDSTGSLVSAEFSIDRRYLNFLIGGGYRPGEAGMNLMVDGKIVRTATGGDDEKLDWAAWDLDGLKGRQARLEIFDRATGGWGHVNVDQIVQSDVAKGEVQSTLVVTNRPLYQETYRPQFHFTARSNWLNDPNGLVEYKGEYHLFFQHNPSSVNWGNMTWGHAVSTNLTHWSQLEHALRPDASGTMFSGSAVVDWNNTSGFQTGEEKPIVCIYTAAGGTSGESKGQPFTQCIAYSNDRGRTFTKWSGNPALPNVAGDNRDPKVFWHDPTRRWVMVVYVPVPGKKGADGKAPTVQALQLYSSPNLKEWKLLSQLDGFFECPDLFELPVDGDRSNTRWVVFGASGEYLTGRFDGTTFTPESGKLRCDFGKNFYAAQTYSDIPAEDGRRILIGWMQGGKYPGMPFNQQMTVPCELTLRATSDGIRMFKWPVKEIEKLRKLFEVSDGDVPGKVPQIPIRMTEELLDIEIEFEPAGNEAGFELNVRGSPVTWKNQTLSALGRSAPLPPVNGRVRLRALVDRASLELFGNQGAIAMSSCFLPRGNRSTEFSFQGSPGQLKKFRAHGLKSAWPETP